MNEEWKSLKGLVEFGDYYEVSNLGRVRSIDRYVNTAKGKRIVKGKILAPRKLPSGYLRVHFSSDSIHKEYRIHRLVAIAFIPNPHNLPEVNHIDECKENNCVDNLEWLSKIDNIRYSQNKPIRVFNKQTHKLIGTYPSITEASQELGILATHITRVLKRKRKSAGGCYFEYID